jgi:ecotin
MKTAAALAVLLAAAAPCAFAAADPMQAFPPAEPGQARHVIAVPRLPVESDRRVELIVGKTVATDAHNRYFHVGRLERETIKGWGYDRYVLKELGAMAGTLMAVDPNAPKVERFIALGGEPRLLRYNSRLPIVVYVPDGVEVRYRIWRTDPDAVPAPKG